MTRSQAVARVFDVSIGQMLWSRRSAFLAVVVAAPVLFAAVWLATTATFRFRGEVQTGDAMFGVMIWLLYVRFIVPVLGVFYGTSLIADEVDDRTITYLFTRPIPRSTVVLGKYLAYLVATISLVLPSVVLVFFMVAPAAGGSIAGSFPALVSDLAMIALGLMTYGAVFAFVGARVPRPLVIGLVFAFGWEPVVLFLPGFLKRLTVAYYLQTLVRHEMPQDSAVTMLMQAFRETSSVSTAVMMLGIIAALALWLAGRTVERREYVLEQ
jgi:ABC-type transport system involved in multi-copper enzyme maturation permease subunit